MAERFMRSLGFVVVDEEESILATAACLFIAAVLSLLWVSPELARGLLCMG